MTTMIRIPLGVKVRDKVTGLTGITMGRTVWLTGCDQYIVQPPTKDDGTVPETRWFDWMRLEVIDATPLVAHDSQLVGSPAAG